MSHHLEAPCTNGVNNLSPFYSIRDFQLLLQENGCLLVGRLDDP